MGIVWMTVVAFTIFNDNFLILFPATGESVLVRTCSVDDWGSVCGEIRFEQFEHFELGTGDDEPPTEDISGCLSSCDHDGCNASRTIHCGYTSLWVFVLLSLITR